MTKPPHACKINRMHTFFIGVKLSQLLLALTCYLRPIKENSVVLRQFVALNPTSSSKHEFEETNLFHRLQYLDERLVLLIKLPLRHQLQ